MHAQVNKPVTLGKSTYGRGQHDIPADEAQGWFFDALVSAGDIVILRPDNPPVEDITEPVEDVTAKPQRTRKRS